MLWSNQIHLLPRVSSPHLFYFFLISPVGLPRHAGNLFIIIIFLKDFIYLFIRQREREAETPAEGEAGSMQGA